MKHTPGPWAVAEDMGWEPDRTINYEITIVDCGGSEIRHIHEALAGKPTDKREQVEANARLIAAAPEMLDALINVYDNRGEADKLYIVADRLRPIIEKATGLTWEEIQEEIS